MKYLIGAVIFFAAFANSVAFADSGGTLPGRQPSGIAGDSATDRILWVLEDRMQARDLHEKAKDKLSKLSPKQLRLLDSLAVRIIKNDHTTASDIAFLLITALIISS
ncbi:MAG TPA: hypothetical protein VGH16_05920 [Candidatus Binatia bacterium]|jgi:hypothetical protein